MSLTFLSLHAQFNYRDESEVITHTDSDIAPVGYLKVKKYHLEPKPAAVS